MPPNYTTNGSTALVLFIMFIVVMYIFVWRRTKPVAHTGPRAKYPEAKLTTKTDRTIIKLYLDEHEEKLS